MRKRWEYSGDINLEYGGVFIDIADWENGYAGAVRVQACADAGLQGNAWWIEELTVVAPKDDRELQEVLSCWGWWIDPEDGSIINCGGAIVALPNTKRFRLTIAEACISYGKYDQDSSTSIQIGPTDPFHSGETLTCDEILRSNTKLERYVKRNFLNR